MEFSAKQIAEYLQGEIVGDANACVNTFAKIEEGVPGALSFLSNPKYIPYKKKKKSSVVLVNRDFIPEQPVQATLIKVDNAYESLAKLLTLYESMKPKHTGIDPLAFVSPSAKIGENVYLGPFAYVGENAVIGDGVQIYPHAFVGDSAEIGKNCILYSNVNIYHGCKVGNNCVLHSGCVIGADGFGFAPTPQGYEKIPQIGIVILEDNVEIGANTCVDRATMGATVIHAGVKVDNLIQIAHNVEIGENNVFAAQVGVAGSTKIGNHNMVGGQVGFSGHITIGVNNGIGAQSGIPKSIGNNLQIIGTPPVGIKEFYKNYLYIQRLSEMVHDIKDLKKAVDNLSIEQK